MRDKEGDADASLRSVCFGCRHGCGYGRWRVRRTACLAGTIDGATKCCSTVWQSPQGAASLVTGAVSHHEPGDAYTLALDSRERQEVATLSHPSMMPLTPQSQHFTHGLV